MKTIYKLSIAVLLAFAVPIISTAKKTKKTTPLATVCGVVTDNENKPIPGVVVSDGVEVVTTDAEGRYSMTSRKENGWVFVSVPSGYEAPRKKAIPVFWAFLTKPADIPETHDFSLTPVDNKEFVLLNVSDMHLSNQHCDKEQFCSYFLPAVKREIEKADGKPVYTYNLGDMSFDMFWYKQNYAIEDYKKTLDVIDYPTPIFHVVGNHDNDGAVAVGDSTDFASVQRYVRTLGPNYYSFNIGDVHFVSLDNIIYLNEPGGKIFPGINGARNYIRRVTDQQREWLRKDLEKVKNKKAPVIVGMHAPVFKYKGTSDKVESWMSEPEYSEELADCFNDFENVHFVTGHIHYNSTTYARPNIIDHNIGAVSGLWWEPLGKYDQVQPICPDGAPIGMTVFDISGDSIKSWHYQPLLEDNKLSFRSYDMNSVKAMIAENPDWQKFITNYPKRDLTRLEDNVIYINVFDWAPDWKITVTEDGKEINVENKILEDPLLTYTYYLPKTTLENKYPEKINSKLQRHMFKAIASSPTSTVTITVTDRFGNTSTETMTRPKPFNASSH